MSVRRLIGAASAVGVLTAAALLGGAGLASAQEEDQGQGQEQQQGQGQGQNQGQNEDQDEQQDQGQDEQQDEGQEERQDDQDQEEQQEEWFTFSVTGSGEQEVPAGSGEEGASLVASISLTADGDMTYTVTVTGNSEEITSAHIHRGAKGENGDVVVELDPAAVNDGTAAQVKIEPDLAQRIIDNPGNWYVNAHSDSFQPPSGVARGQLVGEDDAEKPDVINTGTGGQLADGRTGPDAGTIAAGGLLIASAAGGAIALRRRSGTDNA